VPRPEEETLFGFQYSLNVPRPVPLGGVCARCVGVFVRAGVFAVMVGVVVAVNVGVIGKSVREERGDGTVRTPAHTAVELDPRLFERILRTLTDSAAGERVHSAFFQKNRQCAVSAPGVSTVSEDMTLPLSTV